jgi:peroxiredoxin
MSPTPEVPVNSIAETAYPFVATSLDGKRISLKELRGRPVVLTFFMIGCSLCWEDLPALEAFQARHSGDGTAFVLISSEGAEVTRAAFTRHPVNMPIVTDLAGALRSAYPSMGWPLFVVVDPKGRYYARTHFGNVNDDISARLNEAWRYVQTNPEMTAVRPAIDPQGPCRLAGEVRAQDSDDPISGANVIFWGKQPVGGTFAGLVRRVSSDTEGRFAIEAVPCTRYVVGVRAPGFTDLPLTVQSLRDETLAPLRMEPLIPGAAPAAVEPLAPWVPPLPEGAAANAMHPRRAPEGARKPAIPRFKPAGEN